MQQFRCLRNSSGNHNFPETVFVHFYLLPIRDIPRLGVVRRSVFLPGLSSLFKNKGSENTQLAPTDKMTPAASVEKI
jgi:hypothetical protein